MTAQLALELIYCDDIRHEVGEKVSFMGVYEGDMSIANFPAQLQRFCIHSKLKVPGEKPPKSVKVTVLSGETVISQAVLDEAAIQSYPVPLRPADTTPEDFFLGMIFAFIHAPFALAGPTVIRVTAEVDGQSVSGSPLRVLQAPLAKSPDPAPPTLSELPAAPAVRAAAKLEQPSRSKK